MTPPRAADGGRRDRDWRAYEMRRRAWRRRDGGPPHFRSGFGCLFALVFLVVVASVVSVVASLLGDLGPVPLVIAVLAAVVVIAALARGLRGIVSDLDRILDATRRIEGGDYSVRVGSTRSELPPIQGLAHGFDTMVERLEVDEEQRRTLLADVSHELRTPLAVITGSLEAIVDGVYPADPDHLSPILEETRVLERLIDDLRTIALSEAGTLPLHAEPCDLDLLAGEVVRSFAPAAASGGISLVSVIDGDLPIVDVDPVRIREVLSNLVSNAIRHTPTGGTVALGGSATAASIVLTVTDSGPGIDPALLPFVFDRFVKGETSRGSGLGLAIARGIVEAHGGTIAAEAPPEGGTRFRATLPRTTDA